jgi:hypothetical protein
LFKKLSKFYEHFYQTLAEGHYQAEPLTLWTLIRPNKQKMPGTGPVEVGTRMLDTSTTVGKRFLWASIFAALSIHALTTTAVVLAVAGAGLLALEYRRSKEAGRQTITEINFAGQKVQGKRADLYHLHKAQEQIMKLSDSFKMASLESTTDTIDRILKGVAEERKRVKVLEGGRFGAKTKAYEFSEPAVKLVDDDEGVKISRAGASPLDMAAAKPAFAKAALNDDEVVEQLMALQESLPPHLAERLRSRMTAVAPAPLPAPAPAPPAMAAATP